MSEVNPRAEIIKEAGQRYAKILKEHGAKGKEHKKARIAAYKDYKKTAKGDADKKYKG